jgi:hypothetical protein
MGNKYCEYCHDGDGYSVFPYYGVAPHVHESEHIIGSTKILSESEWPENFEHDEDSPGCGTYLYCPNCFAGEFNPNKANERGE